MSCKIEEFAKGGEAFVSPRFCCFLEPIYSRLSVFRLNLEVKSESAKVFVDLEANLKGGEKGKRKINCLISAIDHADSRVTIGCINSASLRLVYKRLTIFELQNSQL